ncbi:MAG: hypothetical protein KTR35_02305 [Gammaproteobacteria bacterium]|nr:hypothetical protein [Gammaproteobacteria bacterium]
MNIKPAQLACLILAPDDHHRAEVLEWVEYRRQVTHVELCDSSIELQREMVKRQYDLVAIITSQPQPIVPSCLNHYPDAKILVITTGRKVPSIDKWLGQGVEEVVSLTQPENARRVMYRLLDERVMAHRLALLESQIDEQWGLIDTLIAERKDAVALIQDRRLLQVNNAFTNMTGLTAGAAKDLWLDWLDGPSRLSLQRGQGHELRSEIVKDAASGKSRRLDRLAVQYCGADAELITLDTILEHALNERRTTQKPEPIKNLPTTATDSVTGLPARSTLVKSVQKLLQNSDRKSRYTAMRVRLFGQRSTKLEGIDRTVQDLTLYRAADVLQKSFPEDTVLGRINQNALLIVKPTDNSDSRSIAKRVRNLLGSLGGVLEEPDDLRINTLNVAGASLSADELVARLEKRQPEPATADNA